MFGLFGRKPDFMALLQEAKEKKGAVVIDVREPGEYTQGHVPGSINIPTSQINTVNYEKDTPLYLYCLSGGRSKMAAGFLKQKGFQNIKNMGGIGQYCGELEK
ncbi:rhodanese-like domain-containing protein [Anaerotignum sp.]|uniref:rhodanese-like domain-containing protein n=1 Tax=Anaerotignum sp. TaxID=2039241 RepID=UPI002A91BD7F|nr:rhodanese-like domain-containing protein [Anaerotignum sp.]MCI7656623.1 rhodanese-like domain-containing protein [Clostridia bacterium]MDY5414646.1 rhodanese-like domain-containing protein [Anaerotignum sp.]